METENSPYVRIHKLVPLKCLKFVNSFQDINRSLKYLIGNEYQDSRQNTLLRHATLLIGSNSDTLLQDFHTAFLVLVLFVQAIKRISRLELIGS